MQGYDSIRPHGPYHDYAMQDVHRERIAQINKWKKQEHNDLYWLGILMEEVGEIAKALIELPLELSTMVHIEDEITQTAAVAVAWLEWVIERRLNRGGTLESSRLIMERAIAAGVTFEAQLAYEQAQDKT